MQADSEHLLRRCFQIYILFPSNETIKYSFELKISKQLSHQYSSFNIFDEVIFINVKISCKNKWARGCTWGCSVHRMIVCWGLSRIIAIEKVCNRANNLFLCALFDYHQGSEKILPTLLFIHIIP